MDFDDKDTTGQSPYSEPNYQMHKTLRVFGHFEKPCFLELCRHVTEISVSAGQYLFRPGENDDGIYVVQKGHISVYINEHDQEYEVKKAGPGDSILSVLSVLDVLTDHSSPFKTVSAKAIEDSTILKVPGKAFKELFERNPSSLVRTTQIIAQRLQKVTLLTLHQYLGLSIELTKPTLREPKRTPTDAQVPISSMLAPVPSTSSSVPQIGIPAEPVPVTNLNGKDILGPSEQFAIGQSTSHRGDAQYWKKVASEQLTQVFGLKNEEAALLDGKILVQTYPAGQTLTDEGSENADLMYVLSGGLELAQKSIDDGKSQRAAVVHSHELVGGLAMLSGLPSVYTIRTRVQTRVAIISKETFWKLVDALPKIVLSVAHSVVVRLSPFIRSIDFALDWELCDIGEQLYCKGDPGDSLYVVLSGRLKEVLETRVTEKVVEEYGRGDLVGLVEALTSYPRATTISSVRYSELAKVPSGLLNYIKMRHPQVLTRMIRVLGNCIISQQETKFAQTSTPYTVGYGVDGGTPHVASLNTIAIVAVSEEVPVGPFAQELLYALKSIKPTRLLSRDIIEREIGATALLPANENRLLSHLGQQEDTYSMVLYQCDSGMTTWSKRCIRQADCVLVVANGSMNPTVEQLKELLDQLGDRAQRNLILLWPENTERPNNTKNWLDICGRVSSYYHIRAPIRLFELARQDSKKVAEFYMKKYLKEKVDRSSDFARVARMLTGRSIGLVLGGGGAKGAAHLGVLKALNELKIPIDYVGGTSIGSFVGGLYCSDPDVVRVTQKAREWFKGMTNIWQFVLDLTVPFSAMISGVSFNQTLQKFFGDRLIEDLWIPYFNISTDISHSKMRIHQKGSLWQTARASMGLAGFLPPICDQFDGHQLVDGGYINNLPADVMRSMGVGEILAVDVGSVDETNLTNHGVSLSGFWVMWKKLWSWVTPVKILSQSEIQSRLAYVCCSHQLESVKKAPYCLYIRAPIDKYRSQDFHLFEELYKVGHQYGKPLLEDWIRRKLDNQSGAQLADLSTFNLAALVAKIEPVSYSFESDFSDSETDEEGSEKSATPTPEDKKSKESTKQSNGKSGNGGNRNGNRKGSNEATASQDGKAIADGTVSKTNE